MKVFVETLKGTVIEIEVEPNDTVASVKSKIEIEQEPGKYPAKQHMLMHEGKVLEDTTTLEENKVAESSSLVIMESKTKAHVGESSTAAAARETEAPASESSTAAAAPETEAPASETSTAAAAREAPQTSATLPAPAVTQAPPLSVTQPENAVASNLVAGSISESQVQQLADVLKGSWDRNFLDRALEATGYKGPEALDLLYKDMRYSLPPLAIERKQRTSVATNSSTSDAPVQHIGFSLPSLAKRKKRRSSIATNSPTSDAAAQPSQATLPTAAPATGPIANPLDLLPQGLLDMGADAPAGAAGNLDTGGTSGH